MNRNEFENALVYYENYKNLIKRFSFVNFALHQALNIKKVGTVR